MDFHLSLWQRERERENYHVDMSNLIFLLSHRKFFLSVCSQEKVELSLSFSHTLTGKPNDNVSTRLIFCKRSNFYCFWVANQILLYSFCHVSKIWFFTTFSFPFQSPNGRVEIHLKSIAQLKCKIKLPEVKKNQIWREDICS